MKFDYRYFWNPKSWKPSFKEKDLLSIQNYFLRMLAMIPVDFAQYLPSTWADLSPLINRSIFIGQALLLIQIDILSVIDFFNSLGTGDMEHVNYLATMIIITTISIYNISYYQWNYKKYLRIMDFVNKNFQHRSAFGVTCVTGEQSYLLTKRYCLYWSMCCFGATLQWDIVALYLGARALPLAIDYPFLDPKQTPYFHIIFVMQVVSQFITGMSFANNSNVLFTSAVLICGQFDILFCSVKNLRNTAMMLKGGHVDTLKKIQLEYDLENDELNQYCFSTEIFDTIAENDVECKKRRRQTLRCEETTSSPAPERAYLMDYRDELSVALRDCIRHHYALIEAAEMVEDFVNPYIFFKSLQMTFLLCNLAYTIMTMSNFSIIQYVNFGEYLACNLCDIYAICFIGEMLKQQSTRIGDAIYRCPWYLCGDKFRREIGIMFSWAAKPLVITGGKFYVLDFNKMIAIMKAAISYFTLLRTIGEN